MWSKINSAEAISTLSDIKFVIKILWSPKKQSQKEIILLNVLVTLIYNNTYLKPIVFSQVLDIWKKTNKTLTLQCESIKFWSSTRWISDLNWNQNKISHGMWFWYFYLKKVMITTDCKMSYFFSFNCDRKSSFILYLIIWQINGCSVFR